LIPPIATFSVYGATNRKPRLHVVPDMDWQHKFKTQVLSPNIAEKDSPQYLFTNRRAMRQPVEGSVRHGSMEANSEMFRGIKKGHSHASATVGLKSSTMVSNSSPAEDEENVDQWITGFPEGFEVNAETLARGQERYNIYCSVCHGYAGNGDGLVNQRALALNANGQANWVAAKSLHDPTVKDAAANPTGRIFDTITNGRANMGPYKDQIKVEDRWAIVAYVKALQETGIKPESGNAEAAEATPAEAAAPAAAAATTTPAENHSDAAGTGEPELKLELDSEPGHE